MFEVGIDYNHNAGSLENQGVGRWGEDIGVNMSSTTTLPQPLLHSVYFP